MNARKFVSATVAIGVLLLASCVTTDQVADQSAITPVGKSTFYYDKDAIPGEKPWSSDTFKDDPRAFQFVVIGDRTGGANAEDTFGIAMDQLNLLQPEFVINVGALIE